MPIPQRSSDQKQAINLLATAGFTAAANLLPAEQQNNPQIMAVLRASALQAAASASQVRTIANELKAQPALQQALIAAALNGVAARAAAAQPAPVASEDPSSPTYSLT